MISDKSGELGALRQTVVSASVEMSAESRCNIQHLSVSVRLDRAILCSAEITCPLLASSNKCVRV